MGPNELGGALTNMTQMDFVDRWSAPLDKSVVVVGATTACASNREQAGEALSKRLLHAIINSLAGADIIATVNDAEDTMLYLSVHGLPKQPHTPQLGLQVSRELGLSQPGMTVEAGPASGLMALHFAMSALRKDRCKLALVVEIVLDAQGEEHLSVAILQDRHEAIDRGSQASFVLNHTFMGNKAYDNHDWSENAYIQCDLSEGKPHLAALVDLNRTNEEDASQETIYALCGALNGGTPVVAMLEPVTSDNAPVIDFEPDFSEAPASLFSMNPFVEVQQSSDIPLLLPEELFAEEETEMPEPRQDNFGYASPQAPMGRTWLGLQWEANSNMPPIMGTLEAPEFDAV